MYQKIIIFFVSILMISLTSGCGSPKGDQIDRSGETARVTHLATVEPTVTREPTLPPSLTPTEAVYQDPVFSLNLDISSGTYQEGIYTPENEVFVCDFGNVINGVPYPNLYDNYEEPNYGAAWSMDGYGQSFAIDYFRYSALSSDRKELLENPQTREEGFLKLYTDMLLPYHQNTFPGLEILDQGFVNDHTFYVVWNKPHGSHLYTDNAYEDVQEIYYIIVTGDWFYFASFYRTPSVSDKVFDSGQMQDRLNDFLAGCEFNS